RGGASASDHPDWTAETRPQSGHGPGSLPAAARSPRRIPTASAAALASSRGRSGQDPSAEGDRSGQPNDPSSAAAPLPPEPRRPGIGPAAPTPSSTPARPPP